MRMGCFPRLYLSRTAPKLHCAARSIVFPLPNGLQIVGSIEIVGASDVAGGAIDIENAKSRHPQHLSVIHEIATNDITNGK